MFCSDVKVSAALRLYRAAVGTIWVASKLGGLNIKKCLQPRKTLRGKMVFAGEAGKPTHFLCWERPMPWRKKQVNALREPGVLRGQASEERFAEITSGRSHWQQRLVATCEDSSIEANAEVRESQMGLAHESI